MSYLFTSSGFVALRNEVRQLPTFAIKMIIILAEFVNKSAG
jgi:hypothetical protein